MIVSAASSYAGMITMMRGGGGVKGGKKNQLKNNRFTPTAATFFYYPRRKSAFPAHNLVLTKRRIGGGVPRADMNGVAADPPPPKRKTKFGDPNNPAAVGLGGTDGEEKSREDEKTTSTVATKAPPSPPPLSPPPAPKMKKSSKPAKPTTVVSVSTKTPSPPPSKKAKSTTHVQLLRPIAETPLNRGEPTIGQPSPLGATRFENESVNFALRTQNATRVTLVLYSEEDFKDGKITAEIDLDPKSGFRTERAKDDAVIWHVEVPNLSEKCLYGYRVNGPKLPGHGFDFNKIVLDPYAKHVCCNREGYGETNQRAENDLEKNWPQYASGVPALYNRGSENKAFDWEGVESPEYDLANLTIYEGHVRGIGQTYEDMIGKLPYLKLIGVNCLELLPIHEFNELEYSDENKRNPETGELRRNFWGYSTVNFFTPMTKYAKVGEADCGRKSNDEFKKLVRECHRNDMEVILDVVFNHTAEGNEKGLTLSFRGVDNRSYYVTAPTGEFYNYSGCGNTLNCNHPMVADLIVDSLKHFVEEYHVDGFRFDLASILTREASHYKGEEGPTAEELSLLASAQPNSGINNVNSADSTTNGMPYNDEEEVLYDQDGNPIPKNPLQKIPIGTNLEDPPVLRAISNDPVLRNVKLIAEAWDAGGLYQVGTFPHYGVWAEWNGKFRDDVRNFIKGSDGFVGAMASRLCGSPDIYHASGRKPKSSINFVTCHDGFTLRDLVSYNEKNNFFNGEDNNDGENHNISWNCGSGPEADGPTTDKNIVALRERQMRNFFCALFLSQGVPMITMGDEYGHTKNGNNNTYCHDNYLNYIDWDQALDPLSGDGLKRFCSEMAEFRAQHGAFRLPDFPTDANCQWHGVKPHEPDWEETSRFIAYTISANTPEDPEKFYVAFNANFESILVTLPELPAGLHWRCVLDTSLETPFDFVSAEDISDEDRFTAEAMVRPQLRANRFTILDRSCVVLKAELDDDDDDEEI